MESEDIFVICSHVNFFILFVPELVQLFSLAIEGSQLKEVPLPGTTPGTS